MCYFIVYDQGSMKKSSRFHHLKKTWLEKHKKLHEKMLQTHKNVAHLLLPAKQHAIGTFMLSTTPFISIAPATVSAVPTITYEAPHHVSPISQSQLAALLKQKLPHDVRPLTPQEEQDIAAILSESYHMNVSPQLNGVRLNRSYGLIGKEQHLTRYPGDSVYDQLDGSSETPASDGMAPGLGAWGYFARSKADMRPVDSLREKYYIAVPTFLAPGWETHVGQYGLFFKYRKMLVVNPENQKAIVADIADAGPAPWTGKHLGGSPEVMHYLGRVDGAQRGPVLYFFIDDPHDTIPLGPAHL